MDINLSDGVIFEQPSTMDKREEVAESCGIHLELSIPMLIDEMSNQVDEAYAALPERLYLIDEEGRVAYRSAWGPMGFNTDEFEEAIRVQLSNRALR